MPAIGITNPNASHVKISGDNEPARETLKKISNDEFLGCNRNCQLVRYELFLAHPQTKVHSALLVHKNALKQFGF